MLGEENPYSKEYEIGTYNSASMNIRWNLKLFVRKLGYDIVPYGTTPEISRRMMLLNGFRIKLILDVGANEGQFTASMIKLGYAGRIVSFEPLSSAYSVLMRNAQNNPNWEVAKIALGDENKNSKIHISENNRASSLREMHPSLHRYYRSIGNEVITVRRLDSVYDEYLRGDENVYLKIDTQGFEKNVIIGAENVLMRIHGIQMELSLVTLYQGETLIAEMIRFMSSKGFTLVSIEPGFYDKSTGQLLQADCIFFRSDLLAGNGFIL